jgi:hypothetical protein
MESRASLFHAKAIHEFGKRRVIFQVFARAAVGGFKKLRAEDRIRLGETASEKKDRRILDSVIVSCYPRPDNVINLFGVARMGVNHEEL